MRRVSILQKSGWVAFYWYPCFRTFIRNAIGYRILCFGRDKMRYFPIGRSNLNLFISTGIFFSFYLTTKRVISESNEIDIASSRKCTTRQICTTPVALDDTSSIFPFSRICKLGWALARKNGKRKRGESAQGCENILRDTATTLNPYLQSSQTVCEETAHKTRHFSDSDHARLIRRNQASLIVYRETFADKYLIRTRIFGRECVCANMSRVECVVCTVKKLSALFGSCVPVRIKFGFRLVRA